jgi:hypothetical protein
MTVYLVGAGRRPLCDFGARSVPAGAEAAQ